MSLLQKRKLFWTLAIILITTEIGYLPVAKKKVKKLHDDLWDITEKIIIIKINSSACLFLCTNFFGHGSAHAGFVDEVTFLYAFLYGWLYLYIK